MNELTQEDADFMISRMLVVESAEAAGLLVATPAGQAGTGVLLIASRKARADGTLPARLVRVVAGPPYEDQEESDVLAVVDFESPSHCDDDGIYLVARADLQAAGEWRRPGWRASRERWRSLLQGQT